MYKHWIWAALFLGLSTTTLAIKPSQVMQPLQEGSDFSTGSQLLRITTEIGDEISRLIMAVDKAASSHDQANKKVHDQVRVWLKDAKTLHAQQRLGEKAGKQADGFDQTRRRLAANHLSKYSSIVSGLSDAMRLSPRAPAPHFLVGDQVIDRTEQLRATTQSLVTTLLEDIEDESKRSTGQLWVKLQPLKTGLEALEMELDVKDEATTETWLRWLFLDEQRVGVAEVLGRIGAVLDELSKAVNSHQAH